MEIRFMPLAITGVLACVIPVRPGSEGDIDGPEDERTELCAIDANWVVGMVPTCDCHVKVLCERLEQPGITWEGLIEEAGRDPRKAELPWSDRMRHTQEEAEDHKQHFFRAADLARGKVAPGNGDG